MNKRGNFWAILVIIGLLFILVMAAIIVAFGSAVLNLVMDEVTPELSSLGMIGNVNATDTARYTIAPVNTFIQNMTWVTGILYIFGLIGIFGIAFAYRASGEKWLIGFFFALVLILVIACIFLSVIYEDFFDDNDDIGNRLKEHQLLSYMILYSPMIIGFCAFFAGIILFSGPGEVSA